MHLKASRELAEDATNFVELIEDSLSRAIAVGMDAVALNGFTDYSGGPAGLLNDGNVGETGSVGAIAWQDLATARTTIQANNYEPNAYMVHPTIGGDLDVLQTGDGSNSAANWLGAPPGVDTLARYTTTSVSTARLYMGQFNMLAIGMRGPLRIEVSDVADDAFAKHQVFVKVTVRFDVTPLDANAFHRLVGITT